MGCLFRVSRFSRGLACGIAVIGALSSGEADAFEVKRTARGELVHWERDAVSFVVDRSIDELPRGHEALGAALGSWSGRVGAPELGESDAATAAVPGYDGVSAIYFRPGGYEPAGRALAITVLTYDNKTGRILDADVIVNGRYRFDVLETPRPASGPHLASTDEILHEDEPRSEQEVYDLTHVLAHEVGHTLGLNDEFARDDALMYRYSKPHDASVRTPTSDDVEGLAHVYSSLLGAHGGGCGGARLSPRGTTASADRAALVAAFSLLAFALARRSGRGASVGAAVSTAGLLALALSASTAAGAEAPRRTSLGAARATVLRAETLVDHGLFRTRVALHTERCLTDSCPSDVEATVWGGTLGDITQEVGGQFAPHEGDEVDLSFLEAEATVVDATAPTRSVAVKTLTRAR